jgi:hypothetical protein
MAEPRGEKTPTLPRDYNIHSPKGKESLSGSNHPTTLNFEKQDKSGVDNKRLLI